MAAILFNKARLELNGTDVSTYVKSVTLNLEKADLDTTTMGDTAVERIVGLGDGSMTVEFVQSFTSSELDSILWGIFNTGTAVLFELRSDSAAIGASNPEYRGSVLPTNYVPLTGAVSDLATTSITWPTSGGVTRAIA